MFPVLCQKETFVNQFEPIRSKPDLLCVFHSLRNHTPSYLLVEDKDEFMRTEVRARRKHAVRGELNIKEYNCKEHEYKGRKYYSLTLQAHRDGELQETPDPTALMLFGWMVSGLTYFFTAKTNRDRIREYIMKGIDENRFD